MNYALCLQALLKLSNKIYNIYPFSPEIYEKYKLQIEPKVTSEKTEYTIDQPTDYYAYNSRENLDKIVDDAKIFTPNMIKSFSQISK